MENRASYLCAKFNADSKTVLVSILALIVFNFYSFEGSKTHFTGEPNIYIYIYIYIHINAYVMTSPRYYDVTHFLTNLNENSTAYVKLKIKDILLQ